MRLRQWGGASYGRRPAGGMSLGLGPRRVTSAYRCQAGGHPVGAGTSPHRHSCHRPPCLSLGTGVAAPTWALGLRLGSGARGVQAGLFPPGAWPLPRGGHVLRGHADHWGHWAPLAPSYLGDGGAEKGAGPAPSTSEVPTECGCSPHSLRTQLCLPICPHRPCLATTLRPLPQECPGPGWARPPPGGPRSTSPRPAAGTPCPSPAATFPWLL